MYFDFDRFDRKENLHIQSEIQYLEQKPRSRIASNCDKMTNNHKSYLKILFYQTKTIVE